MEDWKTPFQENATMLWVERRAKLNQAFNILKIKLGSNTKTTTIAFHPRMKLLFVHV